MDCVNSENGQFQMIQEQHSKMLLARAQRKAKVSGKKAAKKDELHWKTFPGKTVLSDKGALLEKNWSLNGTCEDNLGLQLETCTSSSFNDKVLQEEISELNEAVRVLKDENGRLYKLLGERDEELLKLRKTANEEKKLLLGSGVITDTAAARIMEVSRQNRDLKAELECERSKIKQLGKKLQDAECLKKTAPKEQSPLNVKSDKDLKENAALQEKLTQVSTKMTELRNQCETLKKELKVAHKVLTKEVGEGFNMSRILNEPSGFRGRQQQIIALQNKVAELTNKLQLPSTSGNLSKAGAVRSSLATPYPKSFSPSRDDKHRTAIKKMEKQRKDEQEKVQSDLALLKDDHCKLQQKHEASKVRNKVLSEELKESKQQLKTLLDKGVHDDELIAALTREQKQLKGAANQNLAWLKATAKDTETWKGFEFEKLIGHCQLQEDKIVKLEFELKELKKQEMSAENVNSVTTQTEWQETDSANQWTTTDSANQWTTTEAIHTFVDNNLLHNRMSGGSSLTDIQLNPSDRYLKSASDSAQLHDLRICLQENKTLFMASEAEKNRLLQLAAVLQRRVTASDCKVLDATSELQQLRLKILQLEKELGHHRVTTQHRISKSGGKSRQATSEHENRPKTNHNGSKAEDLQMRLQIQMDENDALKEALNSALKAKEEDLMVYQEMMEHAKKVFLQGLRHFRQNSAPT